MSIEVMTRVWKHSSQKSGALLILLAIADFADDDGYAFPAVHTLAKKARMTERNARYALRALEDAGEIETTPKGGPHGTSGYVVKTGANIAGGQILPGAKTRKGGAKRDTRGGKPIAPNPSLRTTIEPSIEEGASNDAAPAANEAQPQPSRKRAPVKASKPSPTPESQPVDPWQPVKEAISAMFGGLSVTDARTGRVKAAVGQTLAIIGRAAGDDPVLALVLLAKFAGSKDREFCNRLSALPESVGSWLGKHPNGVAHTNGHARPGAHPPPAPDKPMELADPARIAAFRAELKAKNEAAEERTRLALASGAPIRRY